MTQRRSQSLWAAIGLLVFPLAACKLSEVTREGPSPSPGEVSRTDPGFPAEAVLCATRGGALLLSGSGFSPMPVNTLRPEEGLAIPTVRALGPGVELELTVASFDVAQQRINLTLAANALPPGTYDLRVDNPNGQTGTLSGGLVIVPPPTLTRVDPGSALAGQPNPIAVTGTGFRAAGGGTPVAQVTLTRVGTAVTFEATDEALSSATELRATVPASAGVGRYDVTVRNPDGCEATLPNSYELLVPNQLALCSSVNPAFGWVHAATTIEICASNVDGKGLRSTPEAFIQIAGEDVPLRREAFLTAGEPTGTSVMTAVVPSQAENPKIVVGGPYNIRVVNPDGRSGIIPAAFTVLRDPPPRITAINPGRGDQGATVLLTLTGQDFKPAGTGGPVLTVALIAANGTQTACGPATVTLDSPTAGTDTATCTLTLPAATGGYLVRARHLDDGSFGDFALFAVTEASAKLGQATTQMPSLSVARRAHGMAIGTDDLGNRFLYVAGGENGASAALASVELSSISTFGQLGGWTLASQPLPTGRTGLALVSVGRYLYAIGGSGNGTSPLLAASADTVLRAQVLGADSAPVLGPPAAVSGGSLAAGTYYYRVSAVAAAGTVNPLGEGLASDMESIKVSAGGAVRLSWTMPAGAPAVDHYRIYRSPDPDLTAGTERLIATSGTPAFTDTGSPPNLAVRPLPPGSLSAWVAMPEPPDRFDHAAAAVRTGPDGLFLYAVGGRRGPLATDVLATSDEAVLAADGSAVTSWRAGRTLGAARAELILRPVSHAVAATVPQGTHGLAAAAGTGCPRGGGAMGCSALSSVESTAVVASGASVGAMVAWGNGGALMASRVGGTGYLINDFFYAFNGWSGTGGAFSSSSEKSGSTTCTGGPPCAVVFGGFSAATVSFAPGPAYRSATEFYGAYFYFAGGSTGLLPSTTSAVVQRVSY